MTIREQSSFGQSDGIDVNVEWPIGRQARIQLAQAAGRGIARINESFFALFLGLFIVFLESFSRHEDFATDLDRGRITLAQEFQGHGVDRSYVVGNILACRAITTCRAAHQFSVFVKQTYSNAIQFWFSGVTQVGIKTDLESFRYAAMKIIQFVFGKSVIQ